MPSLSGDAKSLNSSSTPSSKEVQEDNPKVDTMASKTSDTKNQSSYFLAGVMCLLIAFGGFVFGWDTGTISGFINMPDYIDRFGQLNPSGSRYLSNVRTGLIVGVFNIGCAIGSVTLGKIGDMYGRKKGLVITMIVYIVGIAVQISASTSWVQFFVGRIITGIAVGSTSVLAPMFISETSPKAIRGALVSSYQLMITCGIFLGYCTCYGSYHNFSDSRQWRIPLGLCFAWALLMITGMSVMPESPRFLIEKGKVDEARQSISRVNKVPADSPLVTTEIENFAQSVETERIAGTASWKELITGQPKIFYRVMLGIIIMSLQQLIGCNYFFYYGTLIFKAVGLEDSFLTSIILGAVNFGSTFLALYVVDHFGRRKTLIGGALGMMICLLSFALIGVKALYPGKYGVDASKPAGNAMIFVTCLYIFFFATTWGPTAFVVISETYPLRIRAKAMGMATASNWSWGFAIAFCTPFITNAIHFAYGFVFFGCAVFAFFYVMACVPETKGLSLEDVDDLYRKFIPGLAFKNRFSKTKSSTAVENSV